MRPRFSDFLDDRPGQPAGEAPAPPPGAFATQAHLFPRGGRPVAAADAIFGSYQANAAFEPPSQTGDEIDPALPETPDASYLSTLDTPALMRLRRSLAKRHHPDLAPAEARAAANRHMAEYNEMIDRELERRRETN
ncbi:MAG: hypothetical protein R3D45_10635 [Rhizobiaceae bacterium]